MKSTMELALGHSSYDGDVSIAVGLNGAQSGAMIREFKNLTSTFRRSAGLNGIHDVMAICSGYEKIVNEQGTHHRFSGEIKGAPSGLVSSTYVKHKIKGEKMLLVDSERVKILSEQQISEDEVKLVHQLIDEAITIVKHAMDKGHQQELFDAINEELCTEEAIELDDEDEGDENND